MRTGTGRVAVVVATVVAAVTTAAPARAAGDLLGGWQRDDGSSRIRMAPCGDAVCGTVTYIKDPASPGKVGQQVFFGMKPDGRGTWNGTAFNPADGKTYTGSATVSGTSLTTKGCALGGLICKSVSWTRI